MHKKIVLTIIVMGIMGIITFMASHVFRNIDIKSKPQDALAENIVMEKAGDHQKVRANNPEIIHIALLGIDSWDDAGRSDAIIVVTLDYKNKKIKLSSFMRDLKVDLHGHGYAKLGHAYGYGGGELMIRTLAGVQLLDGKQTLAYSRIRRVGNADLESTERQRKVLEGVIAKLLVLP